MKREAIEVIEDMLLQYKGDSVIEMTLKELTQKLEQQTKGEKER